MRPLVLSLILFVSVVLPTSGNAQITYRPTPRPEITAASATWQINGEPVFFAGSFYFPAGPTVFFDGQLMARVGEYLTVPIYADTTLEAFSKIFVPIGGAVMKPYERRRAGPLAGTVGSTTPAFPVQVSSEVMRTDAGVGLATGEPLQVPDVPRPVGTSGVVDACPCPAGAPAAAVGTTGIAAGTTGVAAATPARAVERTAVQSLPRPTRNTGISIEFQGGRWVSDGPAQPFFPDRFVPIGEHRGFPVYRAKSGDADTIYVSVVQDGPVAPYSRR